MSLPQPDGVRVEFSVEEGVSGKWDESRIAALVRSIVNRESVRVTTCLIGLHLVSDVTIRALNAEHRGQDVHTDVLSFPLNDPNALHDPNPLHEPNGKRFALPPEEPLYLGDVVVSQPQASEQAEAFGHSVEREIAYLVAHGVLHVLGYDHEHEADRQRMRLKEEEALQPLGFTR